MKRSAFSFAVLVISLSAAASSAVAADGVVGFLAETGTDERPMLAVGTDRGLVFLAADNTMYRSFSHSRTAMDGAEQAWLFYDDVNNDGTPDFVGAGAPSFVVSHEGEPLWGITGGCEQLFVGNFLDDPSQELFCRNGGEVFVWSWDGQMVLEWDGGRRDMGVCFADDYDGDRKLEVQCDVSGGGHLAFDLDFSEPEERAEPATSATQSGVDLSALSAAASGASPIQVGGNSVTLGFADGAIQFNAGETLVSIPVNSATIHSALAADLNRDGSSEVYVGGIDEVYVLSDAGQLLATLPVNPDSTTRDARVSIRSATANGLENSDRDAIRATIEGAGASLTGCYSRQMSSDRYTRTGEMIVELAVGGDGSVSDSTKRHSSLRSPALETCIMGELEDIAFSPAIEGSGIVNVTIDFDFADTP
jgi:hypothetical protein